ncbi:MAG: helix-turn-helix domain-containing protein [Planctomycetes bacterium]|nr:helix-turn-helix domain-containing protein [Planctomycetota bacterium]
MLLNPRQLADHLNVSLSTVYALVESGKLACHRIGVGRGAVRVSEAQLQDYLETAKREPVAVVRRTLRKGPRRKQAQEWF